MNIHTYVMVHKAPNGKVTTLKATLGGDVDARYWANTVEERDGSAVSVQLQNVATLIWPG